MTKIDKTDIENIKLLLNETKIEINKLINEIDMCISQISD